MASFGVSCEIAKKNDPQSLVGRLAKSMRLHRYYGASIDPHIGVQMPTAHRQAMCKGELDIPVKVQERFADRQVRCNLIRLWDEFDFLMNAQYEPLHAIFASVSIDTSSMQMY